MRHVPYDFLHARLAAIFMLSLAAVASTQAALKPKVLSGFLGYLWPPIFLAGATVVGAILHDRLNLLSERAGRRRIRPVAWVGYGSVLFMTFVGTVAGKRDALLLGASILAILHPVFLLLAGMGRGYIGAITNAFALTCCCGVLGGGAAAGAVASYLGTLVFFLGVDLPARRLTEYPVDEMPDAGPVIRKAAGMGLAAAGLLLAFFMVVPPAPYALIARKLELQPVSPGQIGEMVLKLGLITLLASVAFWFALKMAAGGSAPLKEMSLIRVGARRRSEPRPAPAAEVEPVPAGGWRARIVKLYVRLLDRLAQGGFRRRPSQTPREISARLAPSEAAEALTEIFMRARYGAEEPTEADFGRASDAGDLVLKRHEEGQGS